MTNHETLLIIDYTNDFVANDGALTCGKPGQELENYIVNLADSMNDSFIYLPTDIHIAGDKFHPETKLFPPHNEANTWGRELYGKLSDWYQQNKSDRVVILDKTRYSSFAGTNLDILLRERGIDTVHLAGVCSDICVLHTAVDAYNLGYKIIIHQKGIATFTDNGQEWSLNHFKNSLGVTII